MTFCTHGEWVRYHEFVHDGEITGASYAFTADDGTVSVMAYCRHDGCTEFTLFEEERPTLEAIKNKTHEFDLDVDEGFFHVCDLARWIEMWVDLCAIASREIKTSVWMDRLDEVQP